MKRLSKDTSRLPDMTPPTDDKDYAVMVCDKCLCASCWQGEFMCNDAQSAGGTKVMVSKLRKLGKEASFYWLKE